ncbi:cation-transporting ATPase 13A3, partial [Biomphalaria glabrata]
MRLRQVQIIFFSDSRTSVELTTRNSLLQGQSVLNKGTDEELICWGYRKSAWKQVLFYFIVVFTLGAILLVIRWKPEIGCYLRWQHCSLHKAQYVLLKTRFGTKTVIKVEILFEPIDG